MYINAYAYNNNKKRGHKFQRAVIWEVLKRGKGKCEML